MNSKYAQTFPVLFCFFKYSSSMSIIVSEEEQGDMRHHTATARSQTEILEGLN